MEQLAQESNANLVVEKELSRSTENPLLKAHVETIFSLDTGFENANITVAPNNQGAVILVVEGTHRPSIKAEDVALYATQVKEEQTTAEMLNNAVFNDYMQKLNVKVNQKAVGQIISLYKTQE